CARYGSMYYFDYW
nr:immunoglobulin heavy chain junction region [Mus musculus]MBK4189707.1 immunoglobulin heavy chain junction region [Mus musculus]MBK4189708.1 immunoglobulin heavy chain junction region [Mus musculus]